MLISMSAGCEYVFEIPDSENIFFYVISGKVLVNGKTAKARETVTFHNTGEALAVASESGARILLGHARPHGEAVVSYGPFVMNTAEEIQEAIRDYQSGKLA
jgi:redox-sensitive bicupin YhaK (pirin superfamily)